MTALANEVGAVNLSQGFPDFDPPVELMESVKDAMMSGRNQYAPMAGLPELRKAIAAKYSHWFSLPVDPDTEITVTAGGTVALYTVCAALLTQGSRVLIFEPAYDSYAPACIVHGAHVLRTTLRAPEYGPNWDEVFTLAASGLDLIIVNTPHNPTGTVWKPEDIETLATLALNTGCLVLSDEVYDLITYSHKHKPLAAHPALRDRTFTVMSFGKLVHATGWKVGACIAAPLLTSEFRKVHQYLTFSTNTPMQAGLAEFTVDPSVFAGIADVFSAKRRLFLEPLVGTPWGIRECHGTYFQLLDYSLFWKGSDMHLAEVLARHCGVAAIPLSPFSAQATNETALRFCFAKREEVLIEAAKRLATAPQTIKNLATEV